MDSPNMIPVGSGETIPAGTYTTKQVEELHIPCSFELPAHETCKYCGKPLYYLTMVSLGAVRVVRRNLPERCTCEKAKEYWRKRDLRTERRENEREARLTLSGIKSILIA